MHLRCRDMLYDVQKVGSSWGQSWKEKVPVKGDSPCIGAGSPLQTQQVDGDFSLWSKPASTRARNSNAPMAKKKQQTNKNGEKTNGNYMLIELWFSKNLL